MSKNKCEVCHSDNLLTVLDLGKHPLCDDLIKVGATEKCEEFRIEIALCNDCLTAHQLHPVPKRKLFPSSYHYRSAMTKDVLDGMQGLVKRTKEKFGDLSGKFVVDIGCNDGSLLNFFKREGAVVLGVEPTGAALDAMKSGVDTLNDFFDCDIAAKIVSERGHPDFITFTNVFAHIEDMDQLISAVSILMGDNTRLIIENHYLGAVLDRFQFDTFYHEHPRTYSTHSFLEVAARLMRYVEAVEFPARYGGNIRVFIGPQQPGQVEKQRIDEALSSEQGFYQKFEEMRSVISRWQADRELILGKLRVGGRPVYAKAFPGRAAILIRLLNLTHKEIAGVFEKPTSKKIGHYIPGTSIPILSDSHLSDEVTPPAVFLNLAWHISSEIREYMKNINQSYECIDIFDPIDYIN